MSFALPRATVLGLAVGFRFLLDRQTPTTAPPIKRSSNTPPAIAPYTHAGNSFGFGGADTISVVVSNIVVSSFVVVDDTTRVVATGGKERVGGSVRVRVCVGRGSGVGSGVRGAAMGQDRPTGFEHVQNGFMFDEQSTHDSSKKQNALGVDSFGMGPTNRGTPKNLISVSNDNRESSVGRVP
jgi:hypothetical protein